jgi:hypothetical protein
MRSSWRTGGVLGTRADRGSEVTGGLPLNHGLATSGFLRRPAPSPGHGPAQAVASG